MAPPETPPAANGLGLIAGALTTLAFVPQVLHVWRSRSTRDISLATFGLFCVGVLLWLIYGIWVSALPVVLANAATLVLAGAILVAKLKYK